ncbi:Rec8 like protein-domain-containing protein [Xylariaceae sp. FL1019]|nr:Rec8 like protein-domain-containing protein [Xylariaceae sp. FL1019]
MFYSHEILTSHQYGVATIWLVATIGNKSTTRKVTRKAIQDVNVQKACGKILEPGAPIALRLQGNLLYGVSRVYNQQCTYLVTDLKKVQDNMNLFFKTSIGNQLEPDAGQVRPENLMIENDPEFDPSMPIPNLDIDSLFANNRSSQKTSSQMSPFASQNSRLSSSQISGMFQLDLSHSVSSGHGGSPFGLEGLSGAHKLDDEPLIFDQEEDVFGANQDWGLEMDEDGNLVPSGGAVAIHEDEPQLPPLPHTGGAGDMQLDSVHPEGQPAIDEQLDIIMQENPWSEAEPFPERRGEHAPFQNDERPARQAHHASSRKRKILMDGETQVSRRSVQSWQRNYLGLCGKQPTRTTPAGQAKRNAMLLTFGLGLGSIGQNIGVPNFIHPLAVEFSGDKLFTMLTGVEVVEKPRGRRRKVSEVIEEDEQQEERRVKPRLDGEEEQEQDEQARAQQDDVILNLDDPFAESVLPEVGREAEHPMSDHMSSSLMPWNRNSSVVPGSAIRAPGSAQRGRDLSSPTGKGGDIQDIVRYSDDGPVGEAGDFPMGFGSADSSFDGLALPDRDVEGNQPELTEEQAQAQNDSMNSILDTEGQNFMNYMHDTVKENGERRIDEDFDIDRKWVAFDDIFLPRTTPRATAAQAFYHTLCLVTKGKGYVMQDDVDKKPFGTIWVGTRLSEE